MEVRKAIQLFRNMGIRYTLYRMSYEVKKRSGILKKTHPINQAQKHFISLEKWRSIPFKFSDVSQNLVDAERQPTEILANKAEQILKGKIQFFSYEWKDLGSGYDWITNPDNGYQYNKDLHWSDITDYSQTSGDIKYVWEKSRFTYLLTLIRYDFHFEKDLSEFVFSEIESWIDANPINQGPNWRCSQETSLRIFNWCYALSYYRDSLALTEERWSKIQHVIYWSLHHVFHHINFSRIAVRNNHAITETLFLALSNIIFPFITETEKWSQKGRKWLEQEIDYQIYEDGTFLQFSMNYHRVVIQLMSLAIAVTEKNKQRFSDTFYKRAHKSLNFLYQCTMDENGYLPNYGSNDGALFFPWTDSDYRDYRPQLNTLHYQLTGHDLYRDNAITEDRQWTVSINPKNNFNKLEKINNKPQSFNNGGYYIYRNNDKLTFIRCGNHKDRPAQADNLHIDIWIGDKNILWDAGTYKYNTNPDLINYFVGTEGHNSVMVGGNNQMLKGARFIWYFWTQRISAQWTETENSLIFSGEISAFRFLNRKAKHRRMIQISKDKKQWRVTDEVYNLPDVECRQIWHPISDQVKIVPMQNEAQGVKSYKSDYYGEMQEKKSCEIPFYQHIITDISYIE